MMKRINTKIGDVFSVKIDENTVKYFQLIAFDLTQLNSDVIRAFEKLYDIEAKPSLTEIVNGEVEFYAHCVTKFGLKMKLWEKLGNTNELGSLVNILFRDTHDYGIWVNEEPIRISERWYVWKVNESFREVGKLTGENRKAEIGVVINPMEIANRIKTGKYSFFYPGFE